jgi:hypothetical protein
MPGRGVTKLARVRNTRPKRHLHGTYIEWRKSGWSGIAQAETPRQYCLSVMVIYLFDTRRIYADNLAYKVFLLFSRIRFNPQLIDDVCLCTADINHSTGIDLTEMK